jgi:hypothetical protein
MRRIVKSLGVERLEFHESESEPDDDVVDTEQSGEDNQPAET